MEEKKKAGAAAAAVAVFTAASVAVGGLYDSPEAIFPESQENPHVIHMDKYSFDGDDIDEELEEEDDGEDEEEKKKPGLRAAARARINALPMAVRVLLIVPMWVLGSGILFLGGLIWPGMEPVLAKFLGGALLAAIIAGVFILGAKALFPSLPLKKLLNRKTIPIIVILGAILVILDAVLPLFIADYGDIRSTVQSVGMVAVTGTGLIALMVIFLRAEKKEPQPAPAPAPAKIPKTITLEDSAGTFKIRTGK